MIRVRPHTLLFRRVMLGVMLGIVVLIPACVRKPLTQVADRHVPPLLDDLDRSSLRRAITNSLAYLADRPPEQRFTIGPVALTYARLRQSQEFFLTLLDAGLTDEQLDRAIRQHFDIYQAGGLSGFNPGRKMLVTGYFQPVFKGSLTQHGPFRYPLYTVPDDLVRRQNADGKPTFGRMQKGRFVPYWTRREIETGSRLKGRELVWLRDPFDAFVLHIQGSGLIQLDNGSIRAVHYAAKNGRPYRSIGRLLVTTGRMRLEETNLDTLRAYLDAHPEERDEILYHNESFIFFKWSPKRSAVGNLGRELTPGRSIAVDQSCFPPGALAFLTSRRPVVGKNNQIRWTPLNRFVLIQDTGSAIRGAGRVDLFWGTGDQAGSEAGLMKEKGRLYILVLKETDTNQ